MSYTSVLDNTDFRIKAKEGELCRCRLGFLAELTQENHETF